MIFHRPTLFYRWRQRYGKVNELTIDPADHHRYTFDGEWRTMTSNLPEN